MLLAEGAIKEGRVGNLLAWPHAGFGTHVSWAIPADKKTPGVVPRCMVRPLITPEQMLGEANQAQIIYRSDAVHPRHQASFRVFAPLDFLAEVSAHLPDAHEKTTLSCDWDSNRTRGYRRQRGLRGEVEVDTPTGKARAPLDTRRSWARLIRQDYEVDPLVCARCGGTMKIIAVIERPAVIRQILDHLGLSSVPPSLRAPPDPPEGPAADHPHEWSYEPFFDNLPVADPVMA